MNSAPERIWAHCFNTPEHGGWDQWGGYARPNNRHPLDEKEIATGAEYIRLDLHEAELAALRKAADALADAMNDIASDKPTGRECAGSFRRYHIAVAALAIYRATKEPTE